MIRKIFAIFIFVLIAVSIAGYSALAQKRPSEPNVLRINFYQIAREGRVSFTGEGTGKVYDLKNNLIATKEIQQGSVTFRDLPSGDYLIKIEFGACFTFDPGLSCLSRCDPDILLNRPYQYDRNLGAVIDENVFPYEPGKILVIFRETATEADIDTLLGKYELTYQPLREAGTGKILLTFRHGTIKTAEGSEKTVIRDLLKEEIIDKIYLVALKQYYFPRTQESAKPTQSVEPYKDKLPSSTSSQRTQQER